MRISDWSSDVCSSDLCRFSQPQARLLIPLRYLQRPVMRSHTDLSGFLSPKTLDLSALYDGHRSFKSQLKTRLKAQLEQTQTLPSIEDAAGECHVSSQTLRRRLQRLHPRADRKRTRLNSSH